MEKSNKIKGYNGIFASRFRQLLEERKFTQKYVAEKTHSKGQTISQYVNGEVLPNAEKLYEIAKCFGVSSDYLLGISDNPSCVMQIREISKMTGLTEHSIEILIHDVKSTIELGNHNISEPALVPARINTPTFHVINLLLSDKPVNPNYEPIINVLGKILSFNEQPHNETYGLFKHTPKEDILDLADENPHLLTDDEIEKLIEDENSYDMENGPYYYLDRHDVLNLLLVEMQSTIKRYKDEHEKDKK